MAMVSEGFCTSQISCLFTFSLSFVFTSLEFWNHVNVQVIFFSALPKKSGRVENAKQEGRSASSLHVSVTPDLITC